MPEAIQSERPATEPSTGPGPGRRVLVVGADGPRLRRVAAQVGMWGYRAETAPGMEAARARLGAGDVRIVVSDLDLPGGSGLDLCRAVREGQGGYVWFALLAEEDDPSSDRRVAGLRAGADHVLPRSPAPEELRARLAAGTRVLDMEARLAGERARLAEALAEKDRLAAQVESDLREGRRLQRSLMPDPETRYGGVALSVMLRSAGQVGGDLVGHFPTERGRVAFYGIDVSGHGITSALMTARLKGWLADHGGANVAVWLVDARTRYALGPARVAARLNELTLREMTTDHYFTMFYGEFDPATGDLRYVQAGHPAPFVLRADGRLGRVEGTGLPVGLVEGAAWEERRIRLAPGERLVVHSDGFGECDGAEGMLGDAGLAALVRGASARRGQHLLRGLVAGTLDWAGAGGAQDDLSALLLEWDG